MHDLSKKRKNASTPLQYCIPFDEALQGPEIRDYVQQKSRGCKSQRKPRTTAPKKESATHTFANIALQFMWQDTNIPHKTGMKVKRIWQNTLI